MMLCTAIAIFHNIIKLSHQCNEDYDFSLLPPHILANIISHLKRDDLKTSALVCKSWYYATCDPKITKRLIVWIKPGVKNIYFLRRPIKSIRFHDPQFNTFHYRQPIQKFSDTITKLAIYCDKVSHTALFEMLIYLHNLDTVQIYDGGSYFFETNFNRHRKISRHKNRIVKCLGRIKSLEITTLLKGENLEAYKPFWRHCENLVKMHWKRNHKYTESEFKEFIDMFLDPQQNCTLKCINELVIYNICKKWNSQFFEKMVYLNLQNIKKLGISQISSTYYDVMFKEFCKTYQQLVYLYIDGCSDQHLSEICQYITNLETLRIKNCEANNLDEIANLKMLTSLELERVFYAIDDNIICLFQSKPKYLKRLELNIISAELLAAICENCPDLEILKMENVETKDCEPIYRHLVKLENLFIRFSEWAKCHSSTIKSSDEWNITSLRRLRKLHISCFVSGITPSLIKQHPLLDPTFINGIWDPTDEDLIQQELADQQYLNERYDDYSIVAAPIPIESFEIADFEWFANNVL